MDNLASVSSIFLSRLQRGLAACAERNDIIIDFNSGKEEVFFDPLGGRLVLGRRKSDRSREIAIFVGASTKVWLGLSLRGDDLETALHRYVAPLAQDHGWRHSQVMSEIIAPERRFLFLSKEDAAGRMPLEFSDGGYRLANWADQASHEMVLFAGAAIEIMTR